MGCCFIRVAQFQGLVSWLLLYIRGSMPGTSQWAAAVETDVDLILLIWTRHRVKAKKKKHKPNVLESVQQLHVTVRLFSSVSYELYVLCKNVL